MELDRAASDADSPCQMLRVWTWEELGSAGREGFTCRWARDFIESRGADVPADLIDRMVTAVLTWLQPIEALDPEELAKQLPSPDIVARNRNRPTVADLLPEGETMTEGELLASLAEWENLSEPHRDLIRRHMAVVHRRDRRSRPRQPPSGHMIQHPPTSPSKRGKGYPQVEQASVSGWRLR